MNYHKPLFSAEKLIFGDTSFLYHSDTRLKCIPKVDNLPHLMCRRKAICEFYSIINFTKPHFPLYCDPTECYCTLLTVGIKVNH